jgi:hypothetical protein
MRSFRYHIAEKLKKAFYLGIFLLLIGLVNYGLWLTEVIFVLVSIISLVLIKLVAISLRGFQVRNEFSKPISAVVVFTFFFLAASLYDFIVIPNLWVEKYGLSTEGVVIGLRTNGFRRIRRVATYEFNVDGLPVAKSQSISYSMYEKLESSPVVEIKYLSDNPNISYLRDLEQLKLNTFITLVLGFGMLILLYSYEAENRFSHTDDVT